MTVAESAVFDAPVRPRRAPKHAYGLVIAWVFLGIILFVAVAAPLVSPYSPTSQDLSVGGQLQGPSLAHLLGTDADGQDEYDCTQYWCFRTMKDCGPDDGMADRQSCCDPARTCYEEPPTYP